MRKRIWSMTAAIGLAGALVLLISRSGWQARALAGVTAVAVITDAVHTFGVWTGSTASVLTQLYASATSFAGWVIAAIAIQRLLTGKLEAGRTFMLLAALLGRRFGTRPLAPAEGSAASGRPRPPGAEPPRGGARGSRKPTRKSGRR